MQNMQSLQPILQSQIVEHVRQHQNFTGHAQQQPVLPEHVQQLHDRPIQMVEHVRLQQPLRFIDHSPGSKKFLETQNKATKTVRVPARKLATDVDLLQGPSKRGRKRSVERMEIEAAIAQMTTVQKNAPKVETQAPEKRPRLEFSQQQQFVQQLAQYQLPQISPLPQIPQQLPHDLSAQHPYIMPPVSTLVQLPTMPMLPVQETNMVMHQQNQWSSNAVPNYQFLHQHALVSGQPMFAGFFPAFVCPDGNVFVKFQ